LHPVLKETKVYDYVIKHDYMIVAKIKQKDPFIILTPCILLRF